MNNLKGYELLHPDLDSLSSKWYIFTYKHKLYQLSVSIDSFHNDKEYDLKLFSYNRYKSDDINRYNNMKVHLKNNGIELGSISTKSSLKKIFSNLNTILIRKESILNINLSNSFQILLKNPYLKNSLSNFMLL